jgi:hypothetical protein
MRVFIDTVFRSRIWNGTELTFGLTTEIPRLYVASLQPEDRALQTSGSRSVVVISIIDILSCNTKYVVAISVASRVYLSLFGLEELEGDACF